MRDFFFLSDVINITRKYKIRAKEHSEKRYLLYFSDLGVTDFCDCWSGAPC